MSAIAAVILLGVLILATVIGLAWLFSPVAPLGVPGEWGWATIPWSDAHPFAWMVSLSAALLAVVAVGFLTREQSAGSPGRLKKLLCGTAITAMALGWMLTLLNAVPSPYGLARAPFVLFYPRMTGYYTAARTSKLTTREFLGSYETMLRKLEGTERYLHIGTHPPGLILLNRGFLAATATLPALVRVSDSLTPEVVQDAVATIAEESVASHREFSARDGATLWLIALSTFAAAAGCIPLIARLLEKGGHSWNSAWRWSALWMFTPSVAVFLPKDDILFALPALLAGCLWVEALDRDSRWRAFLAGGVCFLGVCCSLAFLPVMLWLVLATVLVWWRQGSPEDRGSSGSTVRARAGALAAGLAGFLMPLVIALAAFEANLPAIWRLNFVNHAEFYQHNDRTYRSWLIANVLELGFAAGPPLFLMALAGLIFRRQGQSPACDWRVLGPAGICVLAILWISGKNMGEAARLWIPFLPWILLSVPRLRSRTASSDTAAPAWLWWATAVLQAVMCIGAATQIDGFGFTEL